MRSSLCVLSVFCSIRSTVHRIFHPVIHFLPFLLAPHFPCGILLLWCNIFLPSPTFFKRSNIFPVPISQLIFHPIFVRPFTLPIPQFPSSSSSPFSKSLTPCLCSPYFISFFTILSLSLSIRLSVSIWYTFLLSPLHVVVFHSI